VSSKCRIAIWKLYGQSTGERALMILLHILEMAELANLAAAIASPLKKIEGKGRKGVWCMISLTLVLPAKLCRLQFEIKWGCEPSTRTAIAVAWGYGATIGKAMWFVSQGRPRGLRAGQGDQVCQLGSQARSRHLFPLSSGCPILLQRATMPGCWHSIPTPSGRLGQHG
jgi:hypothetical protein